MPLPTPPPNGTRHCDWVKWVGNDTYSALLIAQALAGAFTCGVNELPLSLIISWFEQKAAAVLLALGLRNIRLGPTLPAFLTPTLVEVLVNKFGILPIATAEADVAAANLRRKCSAALRGANLRGRVKGF